MQKQSTTIGDPRLQQTLRDTILPEANAQQQMKLSMKSHQQVNMHLHAGQSDKSPEMKRGNTLGPAGLNLHSTGGSSESRGNTFTATRLGTFANSQKHDPQLIHYTNAPNASQVYH